jgi:hypothetical protein
MHVTVQNSILWVVLQAETGCTAAAGCFLFSTVGEEIVTIVTKVVLGIGG